MANPFRRIIWPTEIKANPSVICRFGRVLSWAAAAAAALWFSLVALLLITADSPDLSDGFLVFMLLGPPLFIFAAGRAARYVLGGE